MAGITTAIAVGASAVGGAMKAKAQSKAARQAADAAAFNPFNIRGAGGNVTFGPDGTANVMASPEMQQWQSLLNQQGMGILQGGGFGQQAADFASQFGTNALPGIMQGALDASQQVPTGAFNAFTTNAANNALFGQGFGMNALAAANDFGSRQTGINEGVAQSMFSRGAGALNDIDFRDIAARQLESQRAAARPGEERAVNAKFQNLFNRGVLSQTGGQRQIGELALSQELADIQRVSQADQFANMLGQQNKQFGLSAMAQGLGARAQDQQFNLGAANLFGNLGQGMMQFGAGQAQQGLNAQIGLSDMINSRGQQRLQNVSNLLGFGSQLNASNTNQALGLFGGSRAINADLRNLIALGGNLGGQQAAAGAQQGNFMMQGATSPFGSFLGGMGGGMLTAMG